MAKNATHKSIFPVLISRGHQLFSIDQDTKKYIFHKSQIHQVLSSVDEKNKDLKVAIVGVIASKLDEHHKIYTDLLIQYLENRLQTNEKIVETFIKDFDEHCPRQTSFRNGVYFWPRVYTITSKKKERCRLLILYFDGVSNKTLEILASAICSQMYVFKEDGKLQQILEQELHTLRDSFNRTSNVTLRNPCETVIKSENDPPRSYRMFLKDWVDFNLDFFKHKETMFSDWEQLMRYLVKTESAINDYVSRTELRLIKDVSLLSVESKSGLSEGISGIGSSVKIQENLAKTDPARKHSSGVPMDPVVILDNKRGSIKST